MKRRELAFAAVLLGLTGCAVGPNYKRPAAPMSPAFKEQTGEVSVPGSDWKPAEPRDTQIRGNWWEIFGDAELNALESQIDVSNQNIAQAAAQFAGARAAIRGARADFYPTINVDGSVTRAHTTATATAPAHTGTVYTASADASYEVDVWGRIRRSVESSVATAQASAADLETVRLSMHAELAIDYFQLRSLDVEKQLLETNVEAYEKALQLTINRYNQGVVSGIDVAQAQTQLENTRAQSTDLGVSRAQLEHAIATLIGKTPANFAIERVANVTPVPAIPFGLPSDLLERRPDVAGAERRMAAANAQIGVAVSAYFPKLLLAAVGGYGSSSLSNWFSLPNRFWSVGPELAALLFDGGKRRSVTEQSVAAYDASVAVYRLQVLTALQDVEDNLAALRILGQEAQEQAAATAAAEKAVALAQNRYSAGITTYLEVITAQAVALTAERTAIDIQSRRLTAAVSLIKGLGGGWSDANLPYGAPPPAPTTTAESATGSTTSSAVPEKPR
jgi:NodT family efflux transporter outer membrane factor (OMF) lipoprotein